MVTNCVETGQISKTGDSWVKQNQRVTPRKLARGGHFFSGQTPVLLVSGHLHSIEKLSCRLIPHAFRKIYYKLLIFIYHLFKPTPKSDLDTHKDHPCSDQRDAKPIDRSQPLAQKKRGKNRDENHAQLVDRCDPRGLAQLQRTEIA